MVIDRCHPLSATHPPALSGLDVWLTELPAN